MSDKVCRTDAMRKMLRLGGSYRYVYSDKNGEPLGQIDIFSGDCP